MNIPLYTTLILFLFGQLGRISFFNQQVNIYVYELSLFIYLLFSFISQGFAPLQKIKNSGLIVIAFPLYLVIVFVLSTPFYDVQTNSIGALYLLRLIFYLLFFIYFLYRKKVTSLWLDRAALIGLLCIILSSFIQYFFYPDLRNVMYLGWDPHLYRMVGTFFDPPIAGGIYGIFLFYLLSQEKLSHQLRVVLVGVLGVMIFLTYSRITYIALLLTMCVWIWKQKYFKYIVPFLAIFAAAIIIIPKPFGESVNLLRVFSIESRLNNYEEAIRVWEKSPLVGIGYNRLRYVRDSYESDRTNFESSHAGASFHSSFLVILAAGGFIGLVLFMWLLLFIAKLNDISMYVVLFASIVSITDNVLLHPFILFMLFLLVSHEKIRNPSSKLP